MGSETKVEKLNRGDQEKSAIYITPFPLLHTPILLCFSQKQQGRQQHMLGNSGAPKSK